MNNLAILVNNENITDLVTFRIKFENKNKQNLEVVANLNSNLMDIVNGNIAGKQVMIKNKLTSIIFNCDELVSMGIRINEQTDDFSVYFNCYGNYTIQK